MHRYVGVCPGPQSQCAAAYPGLPGVQWNLLSLSFHCRHSLLCLFWPFLLRGLQVYPSMSVSVTEPHVFKVPSPWSCDWTVPRLLPLVSSRLPSGSGSLLSRGSSVRFASLPLQASSLERQSPCVASCLVHSLCPREPSLQTTAGTTLSVPDLHRQNSFLVGTRLSRHGSRKAQCPLIFGGFHSGQGTPYLWSYGIMLS